MNTHHKFIVTNQGTQAINTIGVMDVTDDKDVSILNAKLKKNHKKSFTVQFGIKQKPLGDCIDFITKKSGLKWLITKLFKNCGCEKRRIYFNRWSIYILYVKLNVSIKYKPMKAAERTKDYLGDPSLESAPISREIRNGTKKTCGCGKSKF